MDLRSWQFRWTFVLGCGLALASPSYGASASVGFERTEIIAAARTLPVGGTLRVGAVPLTVEGGERRETLRLERFEVFGRETRFVLHTPAGERDLPTPANVYLRGQIEGHPGSRVVVTVLESGEVRGLATRLGRSWILGAASVDGPLSTREVAGPETLEEPGGGFRCELDNFGPEAFRAGGPDDEDPLAAVASSLPGAGPSGVAWLPTGAAGRAPEGVVDHTAVIAIETDNEFLALAPFAGNPVLAADYIADLVAYGSSIYADELQTSWSVGLVSLWAVADPWVTSNASCGLLEFGRHWNLNQGATPRTVSHFLSGKGFNSGIAWVGVLCSGGFGANPANFGGCPAPVNAAGNWGGAYGFTGGIDGNFNLNSPSPVWDIVAFTHEIGHNFNSPHTHCYQNVGGNAAAVDNCNAGSCGSTGCYCGATSLPAGCPGAGQGCGTIMSYCHLLSGNLANTSLTLGLGHPYGVAPERVPNRMRSHVVSESGPGCLTFIPPLDLLFSNGFAAGNTNAWSDTFP